ncbi:MAG: prolyl-tRNA synthetase associated domain-containing protein [Methylocystis sp.]|nr:prolyl-tRNA synthetase associated domain-containing protein [Methylocystis sp.]MCA3583346.1 prolyl-tRNA synthetase associated domain-containing protein [Methylocystis sp.]MCA3588833.1 prolyl-tRNA synthetase associated domain-containing protein [Methylocystis sp.]MCA3591865.1 prolyl-tRNA synthetase associated domain-containing protein [Methylocystis sp.]
MHTPDSLFAALDALGITHETISHPPLFTVEQSKALRGAIPGAHTKNLFLKDKKGRFFLVTAVENTQIDLKRLHEVIGGSGRLSFGSAGQLMQHLGVSPGSVTALAVINDTARSVTLILDARLKAFGWINGHPLVNTMTTGLNWEDFLRFLASTGHPPAILAIGEAPTEEASLSEPGASAAP